MSGQHAKHIDEVMRFIFEDIRNERGTPDFMPDDDLLTTGYIDSMGIMRLLAHLESYCEMTIPMEDVTIENFQTCNAIASYLSSRVDSPDQETAPRAIE